MPTKLSTKIITVLLLGTGLGTVFLFQCDDALCIALRRPLENLIKYQSIYAPCEKPITYALGAFDERFGISRTNFLSAVKAAETIWEKPINKDLLAYNDAGKLKINLVYDYRQEATARLNELGIVVKEDQASYNELKLKYDALNIKYTELKAIYSARVAKFNARQSAYVKEVNYWNEQGGAPKEEFNRLQAEQTALKAELAEIKKIEAELDTDVENINSMAIVLNRLAASLNLVVGQYNEIGASRGEEFTEGDYQLSGREQTINIYEFSTRAKLVRVLAHEFGHALGLPHVEDSKAIMYRLNAGTNEKLTTDDVNALKLRCGIK